MQEAVQDASSYTPDHDQARYAQTIKDFKERLQTARAAGLPKSKFAFKSGRKIIFPSVTAASSAANGSSSAIDDSDDSTPTQTPTPFSPRQSSRQDATTSYDSEDAEYDELSYKHLISDPTYNNSLSNLRHSVIDLRHPSSPSIPLHATLAVRHVKGSLLVLGVVDGATHVTNVRNCVLLVETGQLRLHDCKDVDVYLVCASRPIIEHSTGIRFAPLPGAYPPHPQHLFKAPPSSTSTSRDGPAQARTNKWDQVDDFNWLKQTPSPNWTVIPEAERIPDSTWKEVVPGTDKLGLTDILNAVGVRNAEKGRSRRGSETCGGDGF